MKNRQWLFALVGLCSFGELLAQEEPSILDLQKEKVAVLEFALENLKLRMEAGDVALVDLIVTEDKLLKAKLQLEKDPEKRLSLLRQRVANLKTMERVQERNFKVGRSSGQGLQKAKVKRINAQIALRREQEKRTTPK